MDTLYHYCSVEAFFSIISTQTIWLSSVNNMNDSEENKWADRLVFDELRSLVGRAPPADIEAAWTVYQHNKLNPFIFCMSSKPDVLSQWRGYASDGTGFVIGLDANALTKQRHRPRYTAVVADSLTIYPVIYNSVAQTALIRAELEMALAGSSGECNSAALQVVASSLSGHAATFKNPAFSQEEEWRLIHTPMLLGREGGGHQTEIMSTDLSLKQRAVNGDIRSYFEFPLPAGYLREIWLGPKCRVSDLDLTLLLSEKQHHDTPIRRSTASYR